MIINTVPHPIDSFVKNCFIRSKSTHPVLFEEIDEVVARLDGYAVIPKEEYEELILLKKNQPSPLRNR